MKPMSGIIVDDAEMDSYVLASIIEKHIPEVKIIDQASMADQAMNQILLKEPDIVFLDIDMPVKNGIDLARQIRLNNLEMTIVFVTSCNHFAIEAIRLEAFDFLVKPVCLPDLKACVKRLIAKRVNKSPVLPDDNRVDDAKYEKISFKTMSGTIYINPSEIVYCQAEGNYTEIFAHSGNNFIISQRLGAIEKRLSRYGFTRISRSTLINLKYIHRIRRKENKCILQCNNKEYSLQIKGEYRKKWK